MKTKSGTEKLRKGLTAICAHRLVDRGLLDLEAPVATYWPEFAQAGKAAIPVHFLLSHRAGLPAIDALLPIEALYDRDKMTRALAAQKPWWSPARSMAITCSRSGGSWGRWCGGSRGRVLGGAGAKK